MFGFGNAICKLTQTVKQCHKNHRHQHHQIIAAYKGHDFGGLPHVVQEEIAHTHDGAEQQSKEHVGSHSLFEYASGFEFAALAEKRADQWRKAVAVAHEQEGNEVEHAVDERGGGQRISVVAAHHHGVGKTHDDYAQLPNGYGNT